MTVLSRQKRSSPCRLRPANTADQTNQNRPLFRRKTIAVCVALALAGPVNADTTEIRLDDEHRKARLTAVPDGVIGPPDGSAFTTYRIFGSSISDSIVYVDENVTGGSGNRIGNGGSGITGSNLFIRLAEDSGIYGRIHAPAIEGKDIHLISGGMISNSDGADNVAIRLTGMDNKIKFVDASRLRGDITLDDASSKEEGNVLTLRPMFAGEPISRAGGNLNIGTYGHLLVNDVSFHPLDLSSCKTGKRI